MEYYHSTTHGTATGSAMGEVNIGTAEDARAHIIWLIVWGRMGDAQVFARDLPRELHAGVFAGDWYRDVLAALSAEGVFGGQGGDPEVAEITPAMVEEIMQLPGDAKAHTIQDTRESPVELSIAVLSGGDSIVVGRIVNWVLEVGPEQATKHLESCLVALDDPDGDPACQRFVRALLLQGHHPWAQKLIGLIGVQPRHLAVEGLQGAENPFEVALHWIDDAIMTFYHPDEGNKNLMLSAIKDREEAARHLVSLFEAEAGGE